MGTVYLPAFFPRAWLKIRVSEVLIITASAGKIVADAPGWVDLAGCGDVTDVLHRSR